ncbi:hypothetical protein CFAEC_14345 (plasmid) [Corynebacterium faecale]|nr:hypothetical protein CFAEC_14345 [Corynebacterium faecale]
MVRDAAFSSLEPSTSKTASIFFQLCDWAYSNFNAMMRGLKTKRVDMVFTIGHGWEEL